MSTISKIGITIPDNITSSCPSIELFIPPFDTEVGITAVLHISGIDNLSPLWNTWKWQTADIYGVGNVPNPNPTWVDVQTGGLSYIVAGDDTMVRVVLTDGDCVYYSNESGYENAFNTIANVGDYFLSISSPTVSGTATPTPSKIDLTAYVDNSALTENLFTVSTVNDNFTYVYTSGTWMFEYIISYNHTTPNPATFSVQLFKDGVVESGQHLNYSTTGTADFMTALSRGGVFTAALNNIFDFRISILTGSETFDITDLSIIIKPLMPIV